MSPPAERIVPMNRSHAAGAAEMHLLAFREFFLASLGRGFLRAFYRAAAGHEGTVGYVALDESGRVVGACFGLVNATGFFRELFRRRWWLFAVHSIPALLRRPSIVRRLIRARRHQGNPPPLDLRPLGALQSIAVAPRCQGTGLGKALLMAVCREYAQRGVHAVFLTTDAENNERVRRFYGRLGWKLIGYFTTPEGRRMCWYVWLDPAVSWAPGTCP